MVLRRSGLLCGKFLTPALSYCRQTATNWRPNASGAVRLWLRFLKIRLLLHRSQLLCRNSLASPLSGWLEKLIQPFTIVFWTPAIKSGCIPNIVRVALTYDEMLDAVSSGSLTSATGVLL